jgi:periplasmic protein TonB
MKLASLLRQIPSLICVSFAAGCAFTQDSKPRPSNTTANADARVKSEALVASTPIEKSGGNSNPKTEEITRLEAAISREYEGYLKLPRKEFVTSRTAGPHKKYVDACLEKIRKSPQGALTSIRKDTLDGHVQMTISIMPSGMIEDIKVNRSSGNKTFDDAASEMIQRAEPFAEFPAEMKRAVSALSITNSFGLRN